MALQEILPKRAGHRYGDHYYIAVSSARNNKGTQTCITLSKNAMHDMRWMVGDRVSVLFDTDDNTLHIRRNVDVGHVLSCRAYMKNKKRAELVGKCLPSGIRFADRRIPPVKFTFLFKEDCITTVDSIAFIYPETFR